MVSVGSLTGVLGPVDLGVTTSSICSGVLTCSGCSPVSDSEGVSVSKPCKNSASGSRLVRAEVESETNALLCLSWDASLLHSGSWQH